jgi:hypothetical protein
VSPEEAVAYSAWHAASQTDVPKAIEAAEAYLKQFPSGGYAGFLKEWLGKALLPALDAAIKAQNMDGMVATGRQILARDPRT